MVSARRAMSFGLQGLGSLLKGEHLSKQCFFGLHGTSGGKFLFGDGCKSSESI
jgi:hypothetical protein